MGQTDQECVRQCLNGHPDSFGRLVERYQNPLLSYLVGRLGSRDSAEEAAQEAFVRAFFGLYKLDEQGSFFSWLMGIASRVALEQRRKERRQRGAPTAEVGRAPSTAGLADEGLRQAVGDLPQPYAEVVILRYYGGLSCAQVGERLGMPLGTVTKRLSRAYALLRESLGERGSRAERSEVQP